MKDVRDFDMSIVRHTKKGGYLCRPLRLVQNVDFTSKYGCLPLCCLLDPLEGLYNEMGADSLRREVEFEGRHRNHASGPLFVAWSFSRCLRYRLACGTISTLF